MTNKQINAYSAQTTLLADDSLPMQTAAGTTKRVEMGSILDCYGEIGFSGAGTDHDPTTTPEKIVDFDVEISSTGVTASHASNILTINSPGAYDVFVHISAAVDDSETYTLYLAKNDVEIGSAPVDIERKVGELEVIFSGFATGLVATDTLSLWVESTNAGGAAFTPAYLKLKVSKVGV